MCVKLLSSNLERESGFSTTDIVPLDRHEVDPGSRSMSQRTKCHLTCPFHVLFVGLIGITGA